MCKLLALVAAPAVLFAICGANEAEDAGTCSSPSDIRDSQKGTVMLQAKSNIGAPAVDVHADEAAPDGRCVLPPQATWCQVHLKNLPPYWMAVYDVKQKSDVVSSSVCTLGNWDQSDPAEFGVPGQAVDIGANIGYFSLMLAHGGWNVTSFEPMAPNLALLNASLCQNPHLASRVKVLPFGLGPKTERCFMVAPADNLGDGHVQCGTDLASGFNLDPKSSAYIGKYNVQVIGQFTIRRLDQLLLENAISKVDFVKIDCEGYESQVLAGAPTFLSQYQPRLHKLEVWNASFGFSGTHFLNRYTSAGYKFFEDPKCTIPSSAEVKVVAGGLWEGFACKGAR